MKKLLEISLFYKCLPKTTTLWGRVPEIQRERDIFFLSFWAICCPFTPPLPPPPLTTRKMKKQLEMYSFYTCVPKITIVWCMLPEIWKEQDNFLSFWVIFCSFTLLLTPKMKIWKKCTKTLDYFLLFMGFNQPSHMVKQNFQLKRISQSGQDMFLLCLVNTKTKQNVFNWTKANIFLTVIWSCCQPSFYSSCSVNACWNCQA